MWQHLYLHSTPTAQHLQQISEVKSGVKIVTRIKTVVCKEKFRGTTMGSNSGTATTAPHVCKHVKERERARERESEREGERVNMRHLQLSYTYLLSHTHTHTHRHARTHTCACAQAAKSRRNLLQHAYYTTTLASKRN